MSTINKRKILLVSERLILKVMKSKDITKSYVNGLNDPEVNRFLVNVRLKKQTLRTVDGYVKKSLRAKDSILLGILLKGGKKFIGTINISGISYFHYLCSIGVCIFDKNYWGKGYATEALKRVVEFIFDELKLHYIEAGVYKGNRASVNLFKKAGFKLNASFKNLYRHIDTFKEVLMFGKVNHNFDYSVLKCKNK